MTATVYSPTPEAIAQAVAALRAGELVALPTETVYGLAADARNPAAVRKIFSRKGRPVDHPLIVHLPMLAAVDDWARQVPPAARRLMQAFWPGPLTLVLHKAAGVDGVVTGGQDTVALRMPAHPVAQAVLSAFGGAVAAPSANRFGRISPTQAAHVHAEFPDADFLILDGGSSAVGLESTIVDLSVAQPRLLRPGSIRASAIEDLIGPLQRPDDHEGPRTSGRLAAHYAPLTTVELLSAEQVRARSDDPGALWLTPGTLPAGAPGIALSDVPDAYARELYSALRTLDSRGGTRILVVLPPEGEAWAAVHDRLRRAAAGSGSASD